jgi:transposase
VNKVRQDQAAVQAGLILKWNNGMVEGHINQLKFLKRSMYGCANFDLLRLRILHHQKCA